VGFSCHENKIAPFLLIVKILLDFTRARPYPLTMSRKQKGKRGKTISVQLLKDEDRAIRELARFETRSLSDTVRLIVVAELDRRKKAADVPTPKPVGSAA
jgi:hypothetical protein